MRGIRKYTTTYNTIKSLYNGLITQDRLSLAKSITLVESTLARDKENSQALLSLVLEHSKSISPSFRIGLSGSPGVGKSSFIETFGMFLIQRGHRVAVLAVDPSSSRTGGSILGDKTRMTLLSRNPKAYIRPSPSSCNLGGVARNTNEAILLCESAGYDIVLVETVGVGQSETMVADMVDMFVLLVAPGAGDELQGMKKGIMELTDLVLVNKADGHLLTAARHAQMEYTSALKYIQPIYPFWNPSVLPVSSVESKGIQEAWESMELYKSKMLISLELQKKRGLQRQKWMWKQITEDLIYRLKTDRNVKRMVNELETNVYQGNMTSGEAAERILKAFIIDQKSKYKEFLIL